ncbi:helix-turn-helix domain-containing protein [Streptomyces niveus]|uniref:helix-turn-helix domain-containing protein n=1 Tax=Streptomyces niveus TaxID=193462 RepID=UPI000B1EDDFB
MGGRWIRLIHGPSVTGCDYAGAVREPVQRFRTGGAGLTQSQLAERACVHTETIASVEQGRRPLKPDLAALLDQVLLRGR